MRNTMKSMTNLIAMIIVLSTVASTECRADQVIDDDLIVNGNYSGVDYGSTCVGVDCLVGEDFGFDTIRLKDSAPSILFQDTSSTAAFPTNDWRLGASDGNSGNAATFYLEDVTGGSMALQIESGVGGGVALGYGSTLESGVVSVGAAGEERRITNVAAGIDATDAVNMSQFSAYQATVDAAIISGSLTDELQAGVDGINSMQVGLNARLNSLSGEIKEVAASAAALSAVQANPKAEGNTQLSLGLGNYRDKGSVAAGLYRFVASDQVMLNIGASASMNGGDVLSRAGMTFGW